MNNAVVVGAALVLLPFASALAAAPLSPQDRAFVTQAAQGGMAEVAEGKAAVSQSTSPDVQGFGQHMIDDHTKNNQELMALAQQKGLKTPTALDTKHQQELARLQAEPAAKFDRDYIKGQIAGHRQMEKVMQTEIQNGKDPDLKAFAQQTLPVVQQHLQMAQQLQAKGA